MSYYEEDENQLNEFITRSEANNHYINATGDNMQGDLNMNGHKIIELADCPNTSECDSYAVNKKYVDSQIADLDMGLNNYLKIDGGTEKDMLSMTLKKVKIKELTDDIDMDSHKIVNLNLPDSAQDAANKLYVDLEINEMKTALTTLEGSMTQKLENLPEPATSTSAANKNYVDTAVLEQAKQVQPFCCNLYLSPNKITQVRTTVALYPNSTRASQLIIFIGVNNRFVINDNTDVTTHDREFTLFLDKAEFIDVNDNSANKMLMLYFKARNHKTTTARAAIVGTVYYSKRGVNVGTQVYHEDTWKPLANTFRSSDEIETNEPDEPNVVYLSPIYKREDNQEQEERTRVETEQDRVEVTAEDYRKLF